MLVVIVCMQALHSETTMRLCQQEVSWAFQRITVQIEQ